jgi:adenosylcobinamide-phosphate synthase
LSITWIWVMVLAIALDMLLGDPHCFPHPVRWIGSFILHTEKKIRNIFPKSEKGEKLGGCFLVFIVLFVSTAIPYSILWGAKQVNAWVYFFLQVLFCYQLLAMKSLKTESMKVYHELQQKDLQKARYAVSMIVGRDTQNLTEEGVTKAAVETVAENASDGVIAPLFYMILGGPVLCFFYKAVNTMDSMIGYKNEKYLFFGRCAARLDDVLNYIPARIAAACFILAAYLLGYDGKNAYTIFRQDRYQHQSPNSAQTEAACAGALRIQLAGDAWYFGKLHHKPFIGDALRPIEAEDIKRANKLMITASLLAAAIMSLVKVAVCMIL